MVKINIVYDGTIDNEDVSESVEKMCINCGNSIGYSLDNKKIEDFITPFVTNMVFQNICFFWIIKSNKNPHFYFQKHCPYWILNSSWYNTLICSR